ncbi:N-acetylglucosaminyl-phosphatidylinositol de-N-acetylase [Ascosphaera aggregata]|nr:N-acetylglucosaminyl-phosphatidylinositol de-N-acetylase [Ascosphaera aggregata]
MPSIPPPLQFFLLFIPPIISIILPFLVPLPTLPQINNNNAIPTNSRVALLIAHPDDEAMFFSPTLLDLTSPDRGNIVSILCLSDGNAAGLGHVRQNELHASAARLGVGVSDPVMPGKTPTPDQLPLPNPRVTIINDPIRFPDDMTTVWNSTHVADILRNQFATTAFSQEKETGGVGAGTVTNAWSWFRHGKRNAKMSKSVNDDSDLVPTTDLDYLITFDDQGVSSHPNHISLNHGAKEFIRQLRRRSGGEKSPPHIPRLYALNSVNLLRKYSGIIDVLTTRYLIGAEARNVARTARVKSRVESLGTWMPSLPSILGAHATTKDGLDLIAGDILLFQNDVVKYRRAREAMLLAHTSQMVWFRHGWIALGRYMYVNDLKRVHVDENDR